MQKVLDNFFEDIEYISKCKIISQENNKPISVWNMQIDKRTNFPFYWNNETKESKWEMPTEYESYLGELKEFLCDLIKQSDNQKINDSENVKAEFQNILGYSLNDSDDEPDANDKEISSEQLKWFEQQTEEAERHLRNLIERNFYLVLKKISILKQFDNFDKDLVNESIKLQARYEDWIDGFLAQQRLIDKLELILDRFADAESNLSNEKYRLLWNQSLEKYSIKEINSGSISDDLTLLVNKSEEPEEGEILEEAIPSLVDYEDDLEDYVMSDLHNSLQE